MKPDLVSIDDDCEEWDMRNKIEEMLSKEHKSPGRERNWYTQKGGEFANGKGRVLPVFIYCKGGHWEDQCMSYESLTKRRQFFVKNRLCFNCGQTGHRESNWRSKGCFKCKGKHYTSLCEKPQGKNVNRTQC